MLTRHAFELAFLVAMLVLVYTMFVLPPKHLELAATDTLYARAV
jgi:hypothetical protein